MPIRHFKHGEDKDEIANRLRTQRKVRDQVVFIGVAQEKAVTFSGKKVDGEFVFDRDRNKPVYVNYYYNYIDDEDFGPLFLKIRSYAPWSIKLCLTVFITGTCAGMWRACWASISIHTPLIR
jgi:hypothetical protein